MEIVEGIHQVDGVNANVYLLIDGEELAVIDTGMPKNAEKILDYVHRINQQASDISRILLTHCHIDHVGSAYEFN
jgi:glyoxylase-like metal-dependent hydrolase (beta-lactamase superfamily II)